ncbi:MAG: hypothetical protein ACXWQO_05605 [Bdellovibrionota bacterium]
METTTPKTVKPPWYKIVWSIPDALVVLGFLLVLWAHVHIISGSRKKEDSEKPDLGKAILPFKLSLFAVVGGLLATGKIQSILAFGFTSFCVLFILVRTLRIAHNPLAFIDLLILKHLQGGKTYVPDFLEKIIAKRSELNDVPREIPSSLVADTSYFTIIVSKVLLSFAKSPRIPLFIFVTYLSVAMSTTVVLFSVLIRVTYDGDTTHETLNFLQESILRFVAQTDSLHFAVDPRISQWVLAFEGSVSFVFFIFAVLAFGTIASHTGEKLHEKAKIIYDREMAKLTDKSMELLKTEIQSKATAPKVE